jgi:sugar phosphate isomerase/epimerase
MQIGAQLYTVCQHTQTLDGFDSSLKKVADMGYKTVQVSGTCAYDPVWLRDALQKHGLTCVITHVDPENILEKTEQVVREHEIFGCRHIGIGGMPGNMRNTLEGYEEFKRVFLPAAVKMRDLGAKLMYHNHWFEFDKLNGKDVIERIMEDFPADSIDFTLDLGWAAYSGTDVVKLIETLNGRLSRIHLKDYADLPADGSIDTPAYLRPIYEGKLDYDAYIAALEKAGCEYALVEQDWCYTEDPFECLKRSYENVTKRYPNMK